MSTLAVHEPQNKAIAPPLPEPRVAIRIRQAELGGADVKFIDALQKKHNKMVGFMNESRA